MNILFYPIFSDRESITDHFYRLHWYLYPFREHITRITLLHTIDGNEIGALPPYFDKQLLELTKLFTKVDLVKIKNVEDAEKIANKADYVFLWSTDLSQADKLPESGLKPALKKKKIVRIDHSKEQFASSFYLRFAENFQKEVRENTQRSQQIFKGIVKRCQSKTGYIFGTGPGLSFAKDHDFSDGVPIACNSMVKNRALMDRLHPPLIVVADPIFHAGCSSYAAAFRNELIQAMDRYGSDLIVPMRDYHIYKAHLPERLLPRVAAMPFKPADTPNLDLEKSFHVTSTGNILTLFLIPLASTLFSEAKIFGCDGRPLEDNKYFWGHDKASQFNDEMDNIQKAHPAFFEINYDDYYLTHIDILDRWLTAAEKNGTPFMNLSPSYIPALLSRSIEGIGSPDEHTEKKGAVAMNGSAISKKQNSKPDISIIMPAYNAADYIEIAVQSVKNQNVENWELLIIDDGSTDATVEIVKGLAALDKRIKLLKNPKKGVSTARNMGIEKAAGQFIGFLDADDSYLDGALSARLRALNKNKGLALVHGPTHFIDQAGLDLGWILQLRRTLSFKDMSGNPAHLNSILGRNFLIKKFRFEENVTNGEDWWFLARILRSGAKSDFVPDGGATYRIHGDSTVLKNMNRHEEHLRKVIEWLYTETSDPHTASEYAKGLKKPPMPEILQRRVYNLLVWNILQGDTAAVQDTLANKMPSNWLSKQSENWFLNTISVAGIRRFGMSRKDLIHIPDTIKKNISDLIVKTELDQNAALFSQSLNSIFNLDNTIQASQNEETSAIPGNPMGYARSARALLDETKLVYHISDHKPGNVLIDVGGHFGGSSYQFAVKDWKIVAFEPDPENRKKFIQKLGHMDNVFLDTRAVGETVDKAKAFYASDESTGISGMLVFRDTHKQVATVEVTTIEETMKQHDIRHIDFLKIDVEGYDFGVLKGVPWDKIRPEIIECEFEDEKTNLLGHTWSDICDYLVERDYTVYVSEWHPIIRYGIRHEWFGLKKYPCALEDEKAWGNLLAFKNDPGEAAISAALEKVLSADDPQALVRSVAVSPKKKSLNGAGSTIPMISTKEETKKTVSKAVSTPQSKAVSAPKAVSTPKILPTPAYHPYEEAGLTSYARWALWLQEKSPALFQVGQFGMSSLRALKRHPLIALIAGSLLVLLVLLPLLVSSLSAFASLFWAIAGLAIGAILAFLGLRFANNKAQKFASKQALARQSLKAELLREIKKESSQGSSDIKKLQQQLSDQAEKLSNQTQMSDQAQAQQIQTMKEGLQQKGKMDTETRGQLIADIHTLRDQLKSSALSEQRTIQSLRQEITGLHTQLESQIQDKTKSIEHSIVKLNAKNDEKEGLQLELKDTKDTVLKQMSWLQDMLDNQEAIKKSDKKAHKKTRKTMDQLIKNEASQLEKNMQQQVSQKVENSVQSTVRTVGDQIQNMDAQLKKMQAESQKYSLELEKKLEGQIQDNIGGSAKAQAEVLNTKLAELNSEGQKQQQSLKDEMAQLKNSQAESQKYSQELEKKLEGQIQDNIGGSAKAQAEVLNTKLAELNSEGQKQQQSLKDEMAQLKNSQAESQKFNRELEKKLTGQIQDDIGGSVKAQTQVLDAKLAKLTSEGQKEQQTLKNEINQLERNIQIGVNQKIEEATKGKIGDLLTQSTALRTQVSSLQTLVKSKEKAQGDLTSSMALQHSQMKGLEVSLSSSLQKMKQLEGQTQKSDETINRLKSSAPVFNFGDYQTFNRKLNPSHITTLQEDWSRKISLPIVPKALYYLSHRICTLESQMHGRLATTIEDAILRVLVAASVKSENLRILEIGTLFGIGLAMIYDHTSNRFKSVHLTALDPLDGYYSKETRDIVTDERIDEKTFFSNMKLANIPTEDVTLIKHMSTDDVAIDEAREGGEYDVLIIDGDHSYAGVKADFLLYLPFVSRGGYIIFDDYGAPDWPGVKEFVDETVMKHPDVALMGSSWRTIVFKVVQKETPIHANRNRTDKPKDKEPTKRFSASSNKPSLS